MKQFRDEVYTTRRSRPRGGVLIASLIILLVLTLIGFAATRGSTLKDKLAGNSRDRQLAFQAAETALRDCEAWLRARGVGNFNSAHGLYDGANNSPQWNTIDWSSPDAMRIYATALKPQITGQPKCFIVRNQAPHSIAGQSLAADAPPANSDMYRVISRGVGGDSHTVVILQSTDRH